MAGTEAVEQAHELYRGGRHREALELYTAALAAARGPAQRIALHSNRAACYLKLHDFHKEERVQNKQQRRQYEIFWERETDLPERVANEWREAGAKSDLGEVMQGLDRVMSMLQEWSKKRFGNILRELGKARKQLELLQLNNADQREIRKATDHMNELLYKEEMLWIQRSRITWLKEGDRNTRFFHQKAVWRARKNKIKKLKDNEGVWQDVPTEMERMATSYFQELFTRDPSLNSEMLIGLVQEKVSTEMNEALCKEFTDEEIGDAMFQIGPLKAPGVDGFPARFYQRNWGTIKVEAAEECTSVLELDTEHAGALMLRAQTLVTLKDYQSALFDVNRLIEINPSSEVYRNLHARLKTQLSLAPILESEEESLYTEEDKDDLPLKEDKMNETFVAKSDQPAAELIPEKKPASEPPKVELPPSLASKPQGWETVQKPKGHSGLDYSKWDKVEDDSSEDDEDDDEDEVPQYKFKVRTIGVRSVK